MSHRENQRADQDIEADEDTPLTQNAQNQATNTARNPTAPPDTFNSYKKDGDYYLGITLGFIFGVFSFLFYICKGEKSFRWGICIGVMVHIAINILGMLFYLIDKRAPESK